MAKLIDIPADIHPVNDDDEPELEGGKPVVVRWWEFVRRLTRDPRFAELEGGGFSVDDLELALETRKGAKEAYMTGGPWLVDDAVHARLVRVVRAPAGGWQAGADQLLPFMRAVLDAKDAPATAEKTS